jgi:hypothetical protein
VSKYLLVGLSHPQVQIAGGLFTEAGKKLPVGFALIASQGGEFVGTW